MDWNWFFSALAQSIAALVGIVVAIALTVSQFVRERAGDVLREARNLNKEAQRLKDRIDLLGLPDHVAQVRKQALMWLQSHYHPEALQKDLKLIRSQGSVNAVYKKYKFSKYDSPEIVLKELQMISMGEQQIRSSFIMSQEKEVELQKSHRWEEENVDPLYAEARSLAMRTTEFLKEHQDLRAAMEQWDLFLRRLFSWAAFLLITGVALPLWLLPVPQEPLPFWDYFGLPIRCTQNPLCAWKILIIGTFVIGGIVILREYLNIVSTFKTAEIEALKQWQDIEAFSPFFKNPERWESPDLPDLPDLPDSNDQSP